MHEPAYKKILIESPGKLSKKKEQNLLGKFNAFFSEEEARLIRTEDDLFLLVKAMDMKKLESFIADHDQYNGILSLIRNEIERIKSYGLKNGKRNFVDYNKERKVANRKEKEKGRGTFFYTEGHDYSAENHAFPNKMENQIISGDSLHILRKLPDNCVDLVFTSPPYNFGLDYSNHEDAHNWEKYFNTLFEIFDEAIRILKYGGRIIVNVQPLFSDYIPSHHIISNYFMGRKLIWKGEILWEKNNYNCKYTAWGSWKSPASPYLKYTWEFLEIFSKGELKHPGEKGNADITADEFKKFVVAKWSIAPERDMKKWGHPAMFPEKLVERALKLFSFKNDVILDPFNGVGTTTAVAARLGRRFLGIDVSESYCQTARDRLQ